MTSKIGYFPEQNENDLSSYQEDDFVPIDQVPSQKPTTLSETGRHVARTASRVGERIGGALGDAYNSLDSLIDLSEKASPFPESVTKGISAATKFAVKGPVGVLSKPPTSQKIKQASIESSEGLTAPQGKIEKALDEVTENTASLLLGGGAANQGGNVIRNSFNNLARNLGVSLTGQLAKEGAKELGFGETGQEAARTGTMVLGTLLNQINPRDIWTRLYNARDARITPNTTVSANDLINNFNTIRRQINLGGANTAAETQLLREMDTIQGKVQNGQIALEELTAWQQKLNSLRNNYPEIRFDNRQLDPIRQANQTAIAQHPDPVFQQLHREANEVFGVAAQTGRISQFLDRVLPKELRQGFLGQLIGNIVSSPSANAALTGITKATAVAGVGSGIYTAASLLNHVLRSPVLRREYSNLLLNAARENVPGAIQNAKALEANLDKKKVKESIYSDQDFVPIDEY